MSALRRARGFTLLEVVVAMAVLALGLMAIFDLNAGAVVAVPGGPCEGVDLGL